jgi:hypothetical protein
LKHVDQYDTRKKKSRKENAQTKRKGKENEKWSLLTHLTVLEVTRGFGHLGVVVFPLAGNILDLLRWEGVEEQKDARHLDLAQVDLVLNAAGEKKSRRHTIDCSIDDSRYLTWHCIV